jgi:hypothetical protein
MLLVKSLNFNLLSMAQLCDLGFKCIFRVDNVEIISVDGSNLIFKGFRYENLYLVDFNASEAKLSTCLFTKSSMGWLWHRSLGHVGMKQLNRLVKHDLVRGFESAFAPYVGFGVLMTSKLGTNVILMRYVAAISLMKDSKS